MTTTVEAGSDLYFSARCLWNPPAADGSRQIAKVIIETSYPLVLTQSADSTIPPAPAGTTQKVYTVLAFADLEVYGTDVTIHGPISAPGKDVSIVARVVRARPSNSGLAKISVDGGAGATPPDALIKGAPAKGDTANTKGKRGQGVNGTPGAGARVPATSQVMTPGGDGEGRLDPRHNCGDLGNGLAYDPVMDGEPGSEGDAGKKGGTIVLHAWQLDLPATIKPLELSANGGVGGKGQDGQPGADGGDAGAGANFEAGFVTVTPSLNGQPGMGGNGGLGGRGGPGGEGGTIDVRVVTPSSALDRTMPDRSSWVSALLRVPMFADGGRGGPGGDAGLPGMGGKGGKGGKGSGEKFVLLGEYWGNLVRDGFPETRDLGRGSYGHELPRDIYAVEPTDKPAPVPGGGGGEGTLTVMNPATPAQAGVLARTSQLRMVLESIRARFLDAGCDPDDAIRADLDYLAQTLAAIRDGGDRSDPHQKDVAGQMLNAVAVLMRNATTGCDVFGRGRYFVPMLSVATHQKALEKSLAVLQVNEKSYETYQDQLKKATDSAAELETSAQQMGALKGYLTDKLATLNGDRLTTQVAIDNFHDTIDAAKSNLTTQLDAATKEIKDTFTLSPTTIIGCLTQVAFLGMPLEKNTAGEVSFSGLQAMNSALVGATQVAAAVNEGLTTVLSDAGEPVNKEHLIEKLDTVSPGKLDDHLKARENGTYVADDTRKLAIAREDLDNLCHQFRSSLKSMPKVSEAMRSYVDLIDARGRYLQKYNNMVAQQLELVSQIRVATARETQAQSLKTEAALNALPELTAMVSDLFDRSRLQCLDELSLAYRALAFWKAEPCGNVATLIPGKPKVVNYLSLNNAWSQVQGEIIDHLEKALSPAEDFPAVKDQTALGLGQSPCGVWIVLTREQYPDQFDDLEDGFAARFTFEPKTAIPAKDADKPPYRPFHGKADVRLTQVRVFFPGLASGGGPLTVKLAHSGHEWLMNPSGDVVEYRHEPRSLSFVYTPPETGPLVDETKGCVVASALLAGGSEAGLLGLPTDKSALPGCSYAPLGPFTEWTFELPKVDNPGIDREQIERIVLDFHGFNHEFASGVTA